MNDSFGERNENQQYLAVISQLEKRGTYPDRPPGIETTQRALSLLGYSRANVEKRFGSLKNIIVVAGTNGKGSVCAALSALLMSAGERVGLFTSPHLVSHTERIQIDRDPISKEDFVSIYEEIARRTDNLRLTHFEMLTVMAYHYFHQSDVTYAIFEVGLGGKWDSTNAVPHETCVISRIGLDHQQLLGHKLSLIAENKFGIVTKDSIVVSQPFDLSEIEESKTILELKQRIISDTQCKWTEAAACDTIRTGKLEWCIDSKWGRFPISLKGKRGAENTNLALSIFEKLGYDPAKFGKCLTSVKWLGRFDEASIPNKKNIRFIFSADHNVQGFESLFEILTPQWPGRIHFLMGFGCEKNWSKIIGDVTRFSSSEGRQDYYYLTEAPFRGARLLDYEKWLSKAKAAHRDPLSLVGLAYEFSKPGETILVTGSVYLVGHIYTNVNKLKQQIANADKALTLN